LPALRARALKLCLNRNEAKDLVQDTIERALRFQDSFQPGSNLGAWTQRVMFSVFVTRCRKHQREKRALEAFRQDPNAWTRSHHVLTSESLSPRVTLALGELSSNFRAVVHLIDLHELSYKEAAEVLEIPVGTVMSRLFRARRQLAQRLGAAPQSGNAVTTAEAA